MKAVTWTVAKQRGQVSRGEMRMASGSLKAGHMASSREQVLAKQTRLFTIPFSREFKGAEPRLNNGKCSVTWLS